MSRKDKKTILWGIEGILFVAAFAAMICGGMTFGIIFTGLTASQILVTILASLTYFGLGILSFVAMAWLWNREETILDKWS